MKQSLRSTILQILIFFGVAAGLIYWQYTVMSAQHRQEMIAAISSANYWYLLPAFIISFFSHYFRALRWKLMLKPLSIYPSTTNTTLAVFVGYLVNILVPRMGEIAKCTVLARYENKPADKLIGSIVAERLFDTLCFILIFFITLILQYNIISPYVQNIFNNAFYDDSGQFIWKRIAVVVAIGILLFIVLIFFLKKIKHTKLGLIVSRMGEGLKAIMQINEKGQFFIYTILIWLLYTANAIIGFYMISELSKLSWMAGLAVIAVGTLAMIITPGGLGAFPPIVASILFLYGVNNSLGNAYGWVNWGVQTFIVLVLGLLSLVVLPIYNRKKSHV